MPRWNMNSHLYTRMGMVSTDGGEIHTKWSYRHTL